MESIACPVWSIIRKKGIEVGLTEEQMLAAVGIAVQVKNGAAKKTRGYGEKLFGKITETGSCSVEK